MNFQLLVGLAFIGQVALCTKLNLKKSTRARSMNFDDSSAGVDKDGFVTSEGFQLKESKVETSIKRKKSINPDFVTAEESIGAAGETQEVDVKSMSTEIRRTGPYSASMELFTRDPPPVDSKMPLVERKLEESKIDEQFDSQSTLARVLDEKNDDFTARLVQANHKRVARSQEYQTQPKQLSEKQRGAGIFGWIMANKTMFCWIAVIAMVYYSTVANKGKGQMDDGAADFQSPENLNNLTALSSRIARALSDKMVADHSGISGAGFLVEFNEYGERKQTDLVELQKMIHRATAGLNSHGCHNQKVVLCAPPGVQYYVTLLACLRHGVVVIPVPPATLKNFHQIRQLVKKYEVETVVTTQELKSEWKRQEGSDKVSSSRHGREISFIDAQDLVSFPHELLKSGINSKPLQATDCACLCTEDSEDAMVHKIWTSESMDHISETWIEAGISRRCVVGSLAAHTDGTSIGLFLSTLSVGGQFIVSSQDLHHSKKMVEHLGITHCYVPDRLQCVFDWGAARGMFAAITGTGEGNTGAAAYLSKVFIGVPLRSFVEGAKDNRVTVQSMYSSALHFGGAHGSMKEIKVLKHTLWRDGNVVEAPKNAAKDQKEKLYSSGKVRSGVQVRPLLQKEVEEDSFSDEEDQAKVVGDQVMNTVGQIWIQPSLCIGAERYGGIDTMDLEDNLIQTGEYGFISSSNNHLYVLSKQEDFIAVHGSAHSCKRLEDQLRAKVDSNISIFRSEHVDKPGAVVVCEVPNSKDCELMAFKIRDAIVEDGVPLAGIGLVPKGELPGIPGREEVWRAQLKIQWYNQKLQVHIINGWWEMKDDKLVNLDQLTLSQRLAKAEDSDSESEDLLHGVYS